MLQPLSETNELLGSSVKLSDEFEIHSPAYKNLNESSTSESLSELFSGNDPNYHLSSQVKETLKANADLLVDKNILNHLLQSDYRNQMINTQSKKSIVSDAENRLEGKLSNENMDLHSVYNMEKHKRDIPLISFTSTNNICQQSSDHAVASANIPMKVPVIVGKHVSFAPKLNENSCELLRGPAEESGLKTVYLERSFTSYGPELISEKLCEIRHHLELKENSEEANISGLPPSSFLVAKLKSQKQRTKDLEEELTLSEASLTKVTCELEIVQKRLLRRDEQLREAGERIGELQNEWQDVQKKLLFSRDTYRSQNEHLKKVTETLKQEKESVERELRFLTEEQQHLSNLKVHAEDMKFEVGKLSKQSQELIQENQRVNKLLKEAEEKLEHYEKERLPKLEKDVTKLEDENEKLHSKLDNLTVSRNDADEELKGLRERHSALLAKAIEDAEVKDKAVREKEISMELVEKHDMEKVLLAEKLHEEYQNQLQTLLIKRTSEFRAQLDESERKLRTECDAQIREMKKLFDDHRDILSNRNKEEQEILRRKFGKENLLKDSTIQELRNESHALRTQIDAIVSAIHAVVPQSRNGLPLVAKNKHPLEKLSNMPAFHRVREKEEVNKYALYQRGDLESPFAPCEEKDPHKKMSNRAGIFMGPPLIASTSLSYISNSNDDSSPSDIDISKGKKINHRGKLKGKTLTQLQKRKLDQKIKFKEKNIMSAAQLLGSSESLISSGKSNEILREADKEISDIVQCINAITDIPLPASVEKAPSLDTSIQQDVVNRIDEISEHLSNYLGNT